MHKYELAISRTPVHHHERFYSLNLLLRRHHISLLREEARRVHPIEACGILFGKLNQAKAVVEKVVMAPNILRSGERFEINPETVVKAIAESEKKGLPFIGFACMLRGMVLLSELFELEFRSVKIDTFSFSR